MPTKEQKIERTLKRLIDGEAFFKLPSGQYKFNGNKFVPARIARRLPIEFVYTTNKGWDVYKLTDDYLISRPQTNQ